MLHSDKTKFLPVVGVIATIFPLVGAFAVEPAGSAFDGSDASKASLHGSTTASNKTEEAAAGGGHGVEKKQDSHGSPATGEPRKSPKKDKDAEVKLANKELAGTKAHSQVSPDSEEGKMNEVKGFVKLARKEIANGHPDLADRFLESIAAIQLPDEQKKVALREIAELYETKDDKVKAIAIYEKLYFLMKDDSEAPLWLVRLGELYRDVGAYQLAIGRFYDVINMALKIGGRDFESHQGIARKAQREIADTHFIKGDFEQAQKFYNMALRSELSKEDRAVILFRAGHCMFMRNDMPGAVAIFERFLKDYPQHASAAEARYMLASSYRSQGRAQEAYDTVLELLRTAQSNKEKDPKIWIFWQKKAGNEFANDFYQRGEFVNAVTIYQSLAALAEDPEWRWPVVYQMGLCFERLRLEPRAKESYQYILEESEKPEVKAKKLPDSLMSLIDMSKWRSEQLNWETGVNKAIQTLAGPEIKDYSKTR